MITSNAPKEVTPADKRRISKVAILGSGVMGSRIACHFANIGVEVLLLDIVPFNLTDEEKQNPIKRNSLVNQSLKDVLKSKPSPIYQKSFADRITTGNFDDDLHRIKDCDWVLEAVIENLEIKKGLFEKVEQHLKPGALITSNTSGIPIQQMLADRSDSFKQHFCGTHFFNPPRYLRLFEVIPSTETHSEVVDFLMHYGDLYLGKETVLCKDTPAFIANRIGVFSLTAVFNLLEKMDMTVEEVDLLTGTLTGRPKSATFRTCDVVGIDTLVKVANGAYENCPDDEMRDWLKIPDYVMKMVENKWIGDKAGQGFYKKTKKDGKKEILQLDIRSMEYVPRAKPKYASVAAAKAIDSLSGRIKSLASAKDKAAEFVNKLGMYVCEYSSNRVPEIAEEIYKIDQAVKAGFGWEIGPFEQWDVLGVQSWLERMQAEGHQPAKWVSEMLEAGISSFYKIEAGKQYYYDLSKKDYELVPGQESLLSLANLRQNSPVYQNQDVTLIDVGDGVLNLEFHSKMNTIGGGTLQGLNHAIETAEKDFTGLVIGNEGTNFSAGANLGMIFMLAIEQEWDELNFAVKYFQDSVMRIRYSSVPVVVATHGLTLGGGCEITMHSDAAIAAAETYIGLVEVGVGVIPGGGGTKEMVLRASDSFRAVDPQLPTVQEKFVNIATAKVGTSAYEGMELGVLDPQKDTVVVNQKRCLAQAKKRVLELSSAGYTQPVRRDDVLVMGRTGLGGLYAGAEGFRIGGYASDHDLLIARKLAWVMCGGDLTQPQKVSEQYLLDLEREAFLSLCGEKKTLERMQSILQTGKPLRN